MKFGKRYKAAQQASWIYIDYKELKTLLKRLGELSGPELDQGELQFRQDLYNEIDQVNAFFLERERELIAGMSLLSLDAGSARSAIARSGTAQGATISRSATTGNSAVTSASAAAAVAPSATVASGSSEWRDRFISEVYALQRFVVLNYLAVLKIVKKHDKHFVERSVSNDVREHIFGLAFVLSLEHSYLFAECALPHSPVGAVTLNTVSQLTEREIERVLGENAEHYHPKSVGEGISRQQAAKASSSWPGCEQLAAVIAGGIGGSSAGSGACSVGDGSVGVGSRFSTRLSVNLESATNYERMAGTVATSPRIQVPGRPGSRSEQCPSSPTLSAKSLEWVSEAPHLTPMKKCGSAEVSSTMESVPRIICSMELLPSERVATKRVAERVAAEVLGAGPRMDLLESALDQDLIFDLDCELHSKAEETEHV